MDSLITGQHANFRTMPMSSHYFSKEQYPYKKFFEMLTEMQNYDELELIIVTKIKMIDKGTGHTK